jgi:hypothetical protein
VADPAARFEIGDQELATPQHPVGAITQPVEGQTEDRLGPAVLGQAGRDVGVMMLNAPGRQVEIQGQLGR